MWWDQWSEGLLGLTRHFIKYLKMWGRSRIGEEENPRMIATSFLWIHGRRNSQRYMTIFPKGALVTVDWLGRGAVWIQNLHLHIYGIQMHLRSPDYMGSVAADVLSRSFPLLMNWLHGYQRVSICSIIWFTSEFKDFIIWCNCWLIFICRALALLPVGFGYIRYIEHSNI